MSKYVKIGVGDVIYYINKNYCSEIDINAGISLIQLSDFIVTRNNNAIAKCKHTVEGILDAYIRSLE